MDSFDSIAVDLINEMNSVDVHLKQPEPSVTWEHEDLAKVQIRVFRGHSDTVKSCRFCAGDSRLLSASFDQTVLLWDAVSGQLLNKYVGGHTKYITNAAANNDASRFASTGWDKNVCMWDTETGRILWTGNHGGMILGCDFSHSGHLVVTSSDLDFTVRVWDSHNGTLVQELKDLHTSSITSCYFNPTDDRIFTTSMDHLCRAWDLKSSTNTLTLKGHTNVVSDSSCSADEHKLVTVSWDKSIKVWDVSTGEYRLNGCGTVEKSHGGCVSSCDLSPDGTLLVTGGYDNQVCLWDVDSKVQKLKLQGHSDWVEDVSISKDKKWILSCSKDKTIRMWNIENADNIPMVIQTKKTTGLKLLTCKQCAKPFSAAQADAADEVKLCVFCRLGKSLHQVT
jgi:WD40 repeat protein